MSYRSERMARGFWSLDALLDGSDPSKNPVLSDNGDGARQIRRAPWVESARPESAPYRGKCAAEARRRLAAAGLARLLPVLDQVILNGKNRRESICNLAMKWRIPAQSARRKYYRGVAELTELFSPNKINGETLPAKC